MKIKCRFILKYPTNETAKKIKDALEVDNYHFIHTIIENNQLMIDIEAKSVMSLLHTIEDYLSCLSTAENVIIQTEEHIKSEEQVEINKTNGN